MEAYQQKTIFIVDDDPDDRQIILDAFLQHNAELDYLFLDSGEKLIAQLHTDGFPYPALIVLDLNMPGMMGLQALKEIRGNKIFSQIPIMVLTTSTLTADRKASYEWGASCFLNKPDSYEILVEIADAAIKLWLR